MALPLLSYPPKSQNTRVEGYTVQGDDQPRIYSAEALLEYSEMSELIDAAYRQMFFHCFAADREPFLESQLRNNQITVRDFIRGLLLSETFLSSFYEKNSNYRFVEQCIQRVLGRDPYNEREKIAWSIKIATKGVAGFADELLDSDEYMDNFGYDIVPYQRRRSLPGRETGELPFNIKSPRYDEYYRGILGFPKISWQQEVRRFKPQEQQATAGNPSLYLDMARSVAARPASAPQVNTATINIGASVPFRKLNVPINGNMG
ncbi:MAG: phycobilisome rod-core linker polypeptide CpcG [Phormidesmis priestleyi]|uniref:Phycobilisome rod-core linker polypeptide CpcG n=1 Tax=Phormidesmis priestleyi TaxID=268141 RepID=A0A2W4XJD4_9CYAN|nr:MAG: phycobilisome rod-core linker polypeptide CpcG [Phormidesmis priestleyi]